MTIKQRIQIEAKGYAFGDQNEERTFLSGADFAVKEVIELLESKITKLEEQFELETKTPLKISLAAKISNINWIITQLKSEA